MRHVAFPVVLLLLLAGTGAAEEAGPRVRGRMQARFGAREDNQGVWEQRFRLRRVRVDGRWDAAGWLRLVTEVEGAELLQFDEERGWGVRLVDAFGRLRFHPAAQVHLGYFKKPFSRMKMTSTWDLLVPSRGLMNRLAIAHSSHGGYGGRDIGLMLSGTVEAGAKFRYYLGAFQGPGFVDGSEEHHRDYVARLQARVVKGLVVAVDASHKLYQFGEVTRTVNLFGADLRFRWRGLTLQLEGAFGDNVEALAGHELLGGHVLAAYRIALGEELHLTPAVVLEAVDPDLEVGWGEAIRLACAVNLDVGDRLRVILYAEGRLAAGSYQPAVAADYEVQARNRIFLQLNLMM